MQRLLGDLIERSHDAMLDRIKGPSPGGEKHNSESDHGHYFRGRFGNRRCRRNKNWQEIRDMPWINDRSYRRWGAGWRRVANWRYRGINRGYRGINWRCLDVNLLCR